MKTNIYLSLGEFGYAILLRFYLAYLKQTTNATFSVLCNETNKNLYADICPVVCVGKDYINKFGTIATSGWFPLYKRNEVLSFVKNMLNANYTIKNLPVVIEYLFTNQIHKKPIMYTNEVTNRPAIIICSRVKRIVNPNTNACNYECNKRNIPKEYYCKLIRTLCRVFPMYDVVSIGVPIGSFTFPEIKESNFYDMVGKLISVQDTVNCFNRPCVCVASQSAFSFLCFNQNVPVFTIGENKFLYERKDLCNPSDIFYDIGSINNYSSFNFDDSYKQIKRFIDDRRSVLDN